MPSSPRFRGPPRTPFWRTGQDQGPPRPLRRRAHGVVVMSHGGGPPPDAGPGPRAGSLGCVCGGGLREARACSPSRPDPSLRLNRTPAAAARTPAAVWETPPPLACAGDGPETETGREEETTAPSRAGDVSGIMRRTQHRRLRASGGTAPAARRPAGWGGGGCGIGAGQSTWRAREQRKRRAASRAPKQAARERAVAGRDPPPWRRRRLAAGRPQKCVSCFRRFVESMNGS